MKINYLWFLGMLVNIPVPQIKTVYFCNIEIAPSNPNENVDVNFTISTGFGKIDIVLSVKIINQKLEKTIFNEEVKNFSLQKNYSFLVKKDDLLTTNECQIKAIYEGSEAFVSFPLNRIDNCKFSILEQDFYKSRNDFFSLDEDGNEKYECETISFKGFNPLLDIEKYLYFDIKSLRVTYSCRNLLLTCDNVAIFIKGEKSLFPRLPYNPIEQGYYFTGELIYNDFLDEYLIRLTEDLYVEPSTLMMANYLGDGFIKTEKLFFLKTDFSNNQFIDFSIIFNKLGVNEVIASYEATMGFSQAILGNEEAYFEISSESNFTYDEKYIEVNR